MQPTDNINNPDGLDELLKQAFLELDMSDPENSALMDEMATQVMLADSASLPAKQATGKTIKKGWWLAGITAAIGISAGAWFLLSPSPAIESTQRTEVGTIEMMQPIKSSDSLPSSTKLSDNKTETFYEAIKANKSSVVAKTITRKNSVHADVSISEITDNSANTPFSSENKITDSISSAPKQAETNTSTAAAVIVPLLSEKEKEMHKRKMKEMEDNFAGQRIEDYSIINVSAKTNNSQFFYLKKGEVSIREYKLFLTDLLANGRAEDYLKAKPKLDKIWTDPKDRVNKKLIEQYFKNEKYETYPVICITKEGMEMYCTWLQEKLQEFYKRKNEKVKFTVRLPEESEWKKAAAGKTKYQYATANGKLKSTYWNHLVFFSRQWNANFIEAQPKFVSKTDTLDDSISEHKTHDIKTTNKLTKESFTHPVLSHIATSFMLFNMSGNVSEVVTGTDDSGKKTYRTIGGNWNSTKEFLKINAPDEFNGNIEPSTYIGFRPLIIFSKE